MSKVKQYLIKILFAFAVAPLVGAWIEISMDFTADDTTMSLLLWERGLK